MHACRLEATIVGNPTRAASGGGWGGNGGKAGLQDLSHSQRAGQR
jgi:hypothetical protein